MPFAETSSGAPSRRNRNRRPRAAQSTPSQTPPDLQERHLAAVPPVAVVVADGVEIENFAQLGVPEPIVAALAKTGVTKPFPIQVATVPDALSGRDVLGRGRTGSGKTLAFAIPTVSALARSGERCQPNRPRALILVPTRELANQVAEVVAPLARSLSMTTSVIFGGVGQGAQVTALRKGIDVLIACPGRLEDLIGQGHCRLDRVEVTVLDEADHMADLGFLPAVKRLLDSTPGSGQRLLFSATLDRGVDVLIKRYLTNPVQHSVDTEVSPVDTMTHHVLATSVADKGDVIARLASGHDRSLLFTRTKHGAKKLTKQLTMSGIPAVELHGNLSQGTRERNLDAFSKGSVKVLVATDIAARGIHVDDIGLVVHVDPPAEHKAYLHRSGRTARAGAEGVVITLIVPGQAGDVAALARAAGISPTVTKVTPSHELLEELAGPAAPFVEPVIVAAPPPSSRAPRSGPPRRSGGGSGFGSGRAGSGRSSGSSSGRGRSGRR